MVAFEHDNAKPVAASKFIFFNNKKCWKSPSSHVRQGLRRCYYWIPSTVKISQSKTPWHYWQESPNFIKFGSWGREMGPLISKKSRLVNYYNSARMIPLTALLKRNALSISKFNGTINFRLPKSVSCFCFGNGVAYFPKVIPTGFWQQKREGRFTEHIKPTKHLLGGLPFKMIFTPASLEVLLFMKGTPFLTFTRNPVFSPGCKLWQ